MLTLADPVLSIGEIHLLPPTLFTSCYLAYLTSNLSNGQLTSNKIAHKKLNDLLAQFFMFLLCGVIIFVWIVSSNKHPLNG